MTRSVIGDALDGDPLGTGGTRAALVLGFVIPAGLYVMAVSVRCIFGATTVRFAVADFVLTIPSVVLVFGTMLLSVRWSDRRSHSLARTLAFAFLTSAVMMGVANMGRYALVRWRPELFPPDPGIPVSIGFALSSAVTDSVPLTIFWSGLFILPLVLRGAERQRAEIATVRRDAELMRLRAHLEPHFVLNTLNTVAGLVVDDPLRARRTIGLLGDLFRDATRDRDHDLHSFGDELAWLERYAAIHQARHGRMIRFVWAIAAEATTMSVPRLVLQPVFENAVAHGALRAVGGGTVRTAARVVVVAGGPRLVCEIEDDGPGFASDTPRPGASGLRIVERRLALAHPDATLAIARSGGMTRITITIPALAPEGVT